MSYTAYALVVSERPGEEPDEVEIASYQSLDDAIRDMLVSWPADDSDVMGYGNDSRQTGPLSSRFLHISCPAEFAFCGITRTRPRFQLLLLDRGVG